MNFVEIGRAKVRVVFRERQSGDGGELRFKYYVKATGKSFAYASRAFLWMNRRPDVEAARDAVLGFNDHRCEGISGRDCPAELIAQRGRVTVFEVDARIMGKRTVH